VADSVNVKMNKDNSAVVVTVFGKRGGGHGDL